MATKEIKEKWAYSDDGELFSNQCDSKEEAIEELKAEDYEHGYVARVVGISREDLIDNSLDINSLFENMQEQLYDIAGEAAECFDYSPCWNREKRTEAENKLQADLTKLIYEFMKEQEIELNCYRVADVEPVDMGEVTDGN
jgi:hypothetical protein